MDEESSFSKKKPIEELKERLRKFGVVLVPLSELKTHEQVSDEDITSLKKSLLEESKRILKFPIVCDKNHNIIIDGHCRYNIFKELNFKKVPVYYVDYFDEKIKVDVWREGEKVTKEEVVETAKEGKNFPPKTTKHMYVCNGECVKILEILPQINVPIDKLKNDCP